MAERYAAVADFTARIPDAASLGSPTIQVALDDAESWIDLRAFGRKSLQAHVLLAAHLLAIRTGALGGAAGPVTSMRAGEIGATFAAPISTSALATTRWGAEFSAIVRSLPPSFQVG
jgi:hypothetical protein